MKKKLLAGLATVLLMGGIAGVADATLVKYSFSGTVIVTTEQNPDLPPAPSVGSIVTGGFSYETDNAVGAGAGTYKFYTEPASFFVSVNNLIFSMDLSSLEPGMNFQAGLEVLVRNDEALGGSQTTDVFEVQGFGSSNTFPFTVDSVNEIFFSIQDLTGTLIQDTSLPSELNLTNAPFHNYIVMVDLIDSTHREWAFIARIDTMSPVPTPPPAITIAATPATLWPPNGRMVPVTISGTITDADSDVDVSTVAYAVTDEYRQVQPTGSVTLRSDGRYSFTIQLQASRNGNDQNGRQYTITVSAQDHAGNTGSAATAVIVPHDQGR